MRKDFETGVDPHRDPRVLVIIGKECAVLDGNRHAPLSPKLAGDYSF